MKKLHNTDQVSTFLRCTSDLPFLLRFDEFPFMVNGLSASIIVVASFLAFTACAPSQQALVDEQSTAIDSLQAELEEWRLRYEVIADSIRFYDNVDSGQHARDMRILRDRLDRMYYELNVLRDGGRSVSTIEADDLFEPATAILTSSGESRLDDVADELLSTFEGRPIRVEGHADSVPVTGDLTEQYPSNWELSAARASAVARYFISEHEIAHNRFTVLAFADTEPVASNNSAAGRRQNRRVHIAVMPPPLDHVRVYGEDW